MQLLINEDSRERYFLNVKEAGLEWIEPDVILSNRIVRREDIDISDNAFLAYVAIRAIQRGRYIDTSMNQLYYKLVADKHSEKEQNNRKLRKKIEQGFEELEEEELIQVVYSALDQFTIEAFDLMVFTKKTEKTQDYYVPITLEEIRTIMNIPNIQVEKLLRYFAVLKSTINKESHVGFTGMDKLSTWANIDKKTLIEFNKILEEKKLIYMIHNRSRNSKRTGKLITKPNFYSIYEYRSLCIKYAKKRNCEVA